MLTASTKAAPSHPDIAAAVAGCVLGVLRMATWVVLLAVDSALLTNNDTMIQGVASRLQLDGKPHIPSGRRICCTAQLPCCTSATTVAGLLQCSTCCWASGCNGTACSICRQDAM